MISIEWNRWSRFVLSMQLPFYSCAILLFIHTTAFSAHLYGFVQVFGIVNSHVDFKHQHLVMDGCSDLMMEVFDKPVGYHARSAIGTNTLPLDVSVEIEMIVKFKPDVYDEEEDEEY